MFVLNLIAGGELSFLLGLSRANVFDGYGLGLVRLITYQFTHSLEPFHILMNMLVLYFFGTFAETQVGRRGLIRLYLMSGVVGGVLEMLLGIVLGGAASVPVVGASGSCYGILLYATMMAPRMRVIFIIFPIELRWLTAFLVGVGVYSILLSLRMPGGAGSVAHGAHLGGALWGFVAFRYLRSFYMTADYRQSPLLSRFRRWRAERARKSEAGRQAVLDQLLDKVHREGINALSGAERRFLERASRNAKRK